MWLAAIGIGAAYAGGPAVGAFVGLELASGGFANEDVQVEFGPGPCAGLLVGWRADLAMLHLQPEVQAVYSHTMRDVAIGLGGAVTLSSPVAFGVAAHVGTAPGNGLRWDLLGVVEVVATPKVKPGLRLGVQRVATYPGGGMVYPVVESVVVVAF